MADDIIYAGRRGKGDVVVFQRFHIMDTAGFIGCVRCSLCSKIARRYDGEGVRVEHLCLRDEFKWEDVDGNPLEFPRCTCLYRSDGRNVYFLTDEDYEKFKVYDAMSEARRQAKAEMQDKTKKPQANPKQTPNKPQKQNATR